MKSGARQKNHGGFPRWFLTWVPDEPSTTLVAGSMDHGRSDSDAVSDEDAVATAEGSDTCQGGHTSFVGQLFFDDPMRDDVFTTEAHAPEANLVDSPTAHSWVNPRLPVALGNLLNRLELRRTVREDKESHSKRFARRPPMLVAVSSRAGNERHPRRRRPLTESQRRVRSSNDGSWRPR